jgi:hypothetical protein
MLMINSIKLILIYQLHQMRNSMVMTPFAANSICIPLQNPRYLVHVPIHYFPIIGRLFWVAASFSANATPKNLLW